MAEYIVVDEGLIGAIGKYTRDKVTEKGTELSASIENKVDKVEGSSLATTEQLEQIETNKTAIEGKVDKELGKSLVLDTDITQITTNKTDITTLKSDKADKSALNQYFTKTEITEGYPTKEDLANLGDLKGSCLKSELDSKKAECKPNDMFIVTDDNNHLWYYTGTEFTDTSAVAHVDLSNYYDKSTVDSKFTNKVDKVSGKDLVATADITQITTNKTDIASLKTGKVDKVEGSSLATSAQLTQIETNKTSIGTLTTKVNAIESDLSELATALTEIV